jgi:phosphoribosylformylglycinamidine synthase
MCFGYDPEQSSRSPYEAAKGAVREALAKFCCLGGDPWEARLSLQEYFERPESPASWGKPASALLGALEAQLKRGVPAIGGKDSMSGTYRDPEHGVNLAVPPTLVAFAAGTSGAASVHSGALSGNKGNVIALLSQPPASSGDGAPGEWETFKANMNALKELSAAGFVTSAYPVCSGGVAASMAISGFGNMAGIEAYASAFCSVSADTCQGSVLVEIEGGCSGAAREILERQGVLWLRAGVTLAEPVFRIVQDSGTNPETPSAEIPLAVLRRAYECPLSKVYPQTSTGEAGTGTADADTALKIPGLAPSVSETGASGKQPDTKPRGSAIRRPRSPAPLAVLPVFPGTNCEWDMERSFREAGARTRLAVFRNRNREDIHRSIGELASAINEAQILALSGGFSAGDEPEGSGKFIANVFRSPQIMDAVCGLLEKRGGLILGICNGFQALIKLGLVPYGVYRDAEEGMPTLTFNRIGRHVSRMVRTRVMPASSPWLALEEPGTIHVIPVSHGEGRLAIQGAEAGRLFTRGQVPFCYADAQGSPTLAEPDTPNGSDFAIESLCSPGGRILGKMGHSERCGDYVHINIPGNKKQRIFEAGVNYF